MPAICPSKRVITRRNNARFFQVTILANMHDSAMGPVLVIGASGKVGSALVKLLERQGIGVRAATRTPTAHYPSTAVTRWVRLDFDRPETFDPALDGVTTVFMMARPGDERPEATAVSLITAMRQNGVKRVVNLTAMGCEMRPDFGLRRVELALEASGLAATP